MSRRILPSTETPDLPGPRLVVNLGPTGAGKTHWTRRDWFRWPRALALDTQAPDGIGEYPGILARDPAELFDVLSGIEKRGADRWRVTYRGDPAWDGGDFFTLAAELLRESLLVVEEADKFTTASETPDGIYAVAHHGRRLGQGMILNARRAANIPRDVTALADVVRAWLPDEPLDRKYLAARGFPLAVMEALPSRGHVLRVREAAGPRLYAVAPGAEPILLPARYQTRGDDA